MEEEGPRQYCSTLYLDIDGVVFPAYLPENEYYDIPNAGLTREWVSPVEFYHPEIIEALGRVAANSLVVLSSSRMGGFLEDALYKDLSEKLSIKGALFIDSVRPGAIDAKLDAVRRHWGGVGSYVLDDTPESRGRGLAYTVYGESVLAQGSRAVWVDDHIVNVPNTSRHALNRLTHLAGVSVYAPVTSDGLTLSDVEKIGRLLS